VLIKGTIRVEAIKTETAAKIALVDALWYRKYYGDEDKHHSRNIETLLAALAHKHDTTIAIERQAAGKRLVAREKREERY
jgi:hypothetical protein